MQTQTITQEFEIHAVNVAYFVSMVKKLNKRAARLGIPEITWKIVSRRQEEILGKRFGILNQREVIGYRWLTTLEVIGQSPVLDGYAIAAVIEHTSGGNLLRDATGGSVDLSEYRDSGAHCDHCKVERNRKETVVLIREDQSLVRVGKSCLKDYLGHATITQLAWRADFACLLGEVEDLDDSGLCYGGGGPSCWDLLDFLGWCAASARESGYVTRTAAKLSDSLTSTASAAWSDMSLYYMHPMKYQRELGRCPVTVIQVEDRDRATALAALDYTLADFAAIEAGPDYLNDFQHNLAVIARIGAVEDKHAGYAAAILGYHTRGVAWKEEQKARLAAKEAREAARAEKALVAKHLGTVGDKVLLEVVIGRTIQLPDYGYGCSYLVTMETLSGDAVTWKASSDPGLVVGAQLWIRGTVKEHREYQELPTTSLSRCVVRCPVCNVEGALTKGGRPRKNGAPFKDLARCEHWATVPELLGGGLETSAA